MKMKMKIMEYAIRNEGEMKLRILHLTLKKEWFDLIACGEKKAEFRDVKPYWTKRLMNNGTFKIFDEIYFKNGYRKDSPFMRVEFIKTRYKGKYLYRISLGKILEFKYYELPKIIANETSQKR